MEIENYSFEYLKSGLSVNTHVGCGLGCSYCILTTSIDQFPHYPVCINSAKDIYERMTSNDSLFVDGLTPIYINNRTDPFLPAVIESTYEVLEIFARNNISSPIILISKLAPDARFRKYCHDLRILYFYTYSGLTGLDYNSQDNINRKNLAEIQHNVPLENRYHYLRPIIPGYNDSFSKIESILELVGSKFRATVAGGIRVNNENAEVFGIVGYDKHHKLLPRTAWEMVSEIARRQDHIVIRHTSCAISLHMEASNKLRYFNDEHHCAMNRCPNFEHCAHRCTVNKPLVEQLIRRKSSAQFIWNGEAEIVFSDPAEQELIAFLKSTFGLSVKAPQMILSPSEQHITK